MNRHALLQEAVRGTGTCLIAWPGELPHQAEFFLKQRNKAIKILGRAHLCNFSSWWAHQVPKTERAFKAAVSARGAGAIARGFAPPHPSKQSTCLVWNFIEAGSVTSILLLLIVYYNIVSLRSFDKL